jgi:signal-transduction protein with cAMP-binding, CBS, and nucleotidyltransferase domain
MEEIKTAEDLLNEKGGELISVPPETTIHEALQRMTEKRIGAILVRKEDRYVGIWTERDLMHNTVAPGFDAKTSTVGEHMTTKLVSVPHDASVYSLADKILGLRVRHLLVEREGRHIGLLSSGDVLRANLELRSEQLRQLDGLVRLEYYDAWRWKQKKRT